MARVRELTGAAEDDLLMLAALGRRAEGAPSRGDRVPGVRTIAPVRGAEI